MKKINPSDIAKSYRQVTRDEILKSKLAINIVGFLCNDDPAAKKYADFTRQGCEEVGINFELRKIPRLELEKEILKANDDDSVHGIFIYYPIFNVEQDNYLKNLVSPYKDIEGLSEYWISKLYKNERYDDELKNHKALLPCTPLAMIKIMSHTGFDVKGKTVTIFNRSEVVGRPLASMLSHDGAKVYSFDEHGPLLFENNEISECGVSREEALKESDLVVTGVPSKHFNKIKKEELSENTYGINFSSFQNFESEAVDFLDTFVPRVGPLTVTMCMRNALRLYKNYSRG